MIRKTFPSGGEVNKRNLANGVTSYSVYNANGHFLGKCPEAAAAEYLAITGHTTLDVACRPYTVLRLGELWNRAVACNARVWQDKMGHQLLALDDSHYLYATVNPGNESIRIMDAEELVDWIDLDAPKGPPVYRLTIVEDRSTIFDFA
jgi:hypothetical protein